MLGKRSGLIVICTIVLLILNSYGVSAAFNCLDCHAENGTIQRDIENPHLQTEPIQIASTMSPMGFEIEVLSVSSPPLVYDINTKTKATTAFIVWKTNESTDNRVYYGSNEADITAWVNGTWSHWKNDTLNPSITLTDLSTNTTYYYRIESTDDYGNTNDTDIPVQSFTTALLNMDLSTNRYVILDDPKYSGSNAGSGYENPPNPTLQQNWTGIDWNSDYWDGESTSIRAYVLVMNEQGMSASSVQVNFTLKNPAGTTVNINSSTTDSSGVASYLFDLNNQNYWGTWTIESNSTVNGKYVNSSTDFTLNWWGCALCHGDPGSALFNQTYSLNNNSTNPQFVTPNSPYAKGYDLIHLINASGGNSSDYHANFLVWNIEYGLGHNNFTNNPTGYSPFPDTKCVHCHQSYDGTPGGNTTAGYTDFRADYHNFSCDSHACHSNVKDVLPTWFGPKEPPYYLNNGIPEIPSCGLQYTATQHSRPLCHPIPGDLWDVPHLAGGNGNISNVSTLDAINNDSNGMARVIYSDSIPASGNPLSLHTVDDSVPCVICHGPNHGIKNPDPSTFENRIDNLDDPDEDWVFGGGLCGASDYCHFSKHPKYTCELCHIGLNELTNFNGTTEISHCQTCHTKKQHNASLDCTVCHSQDAHRIQYFDKNGDYGSLNSNAGNCTTCHQKNKLNTILANSKAGTYSGNAPLVNNPITHSENSYNGTLWDRGINFWDNTSQVTTCIYCHGNTTHESTALGYPGIFQGINVVGGDLSGTWCVSCHYRNSTNYDIMAGIMNPVPPEITGNSTYGNYTLAGDGTTIYFDHSNLSSFNDSRCSNCHNNSATTSSELMHGVLSGLGGPDCILCHEGSGASGTLTINMTLFAQSPHVNINNGNDTNNKHCYMCHRDGTAPSDETGHTEHTTGTIRTNATNRICDDVACHGNTSSPISVGSHFENATQYGRLETSFIRTTQTCEFCHGKTQVPIFNQSTPGDGGNTSMVLDDGTGPTGHYVKNLADGDDHYVVDTVGWVEGSKNGSQGCVFCHKTQSAVFGASNISNWANHSSYGNDCYVCHISGTTYLHDLGVITASGGTPDCIDCHGLGKPQADINETAINLSIHKDLNKNAVNVTILNNILSKACWACHGDGSEPSGHVNDSLGVGIPANTTRPLNCSNGQCHVNGTPSGVTITGNQPNATIEHVPESIKNISTDIPTIIAVDCTLCHKNSLTYNNDPVRGDANESDSSNVSHYGTLSSTNISAVQSTSDCTLCHKNATNALVWGNATQIRHPVNKSVDFCVNCHGNGDSLHNDSLFMGIEIHAWGFDWEGDGLDYTIQSGQQFQDNEGCYACHEESTVMGTVDDAGSKICEECHYDGSAGPFSNKITIRSDINSTLPRVFNHINNSTAEVGVSDMSLYFNSESNISTASSCYAYNDATGAGTCHGVSASNNSSGYYAFEVLWAVDDGTMKPYRWTQTIDNLPNTTDCRICHLGAANATVAPFVRSAYWGYPMNVTSTAQTILTHKNSSALASDCWSCHVVGGVQPIDFHDVNITSGGGPDCISCHDVDRSGATRWVNVSAINGSLNSNSSIHYAINNATIGTGGSTGNPDNQICWACHQSDGSEPSGMGDIFETPYKCYDCHNGTAPYSNVSSALGVYQHFVNATNLIAGNVTANTTNSSSCLVCHNLTEMKVDYTEGLDNYSTNYSIPSHYGKDRSDLRTWNSEALGVQTVDCKYCHNNSTSAFKVAMNDPINNSNISEHSLNYPGTTPNCTASSCHVGGWMHNSTLTKPTNLTIESSVLCLSCHGNNGTSGTNYTMPMVTSYKDKHNDTLNCTECHIDNTPRSIHGIKYLQQDAGYATTNTSAVNCTTCHASDAVNSNITNTIPKVPTGSNYNFTHSEDPDNGSRWANASVIAYWNNTNEACEYCHNDTKHQVSAFGLIANIKGSNTRNDAIDGSSNWCSGCHYQAADNYFVVGNWSKIPPTIYYNNVNLPNATDDASVLWFNHTLSNYSDEFCKGCHGNLLSGSPTTREFAHNVNSANTSNCIGCHDALLNIVPSNRQLNISATNNSSESIHYNLNNAITDGDINQRCYACHGNGSVPSTHPSISGTKLCDDCHVNNSNFSAPLVYRHIPNASVPQQHSTSNVTTNYAQCWNCHNNSVNATGTMYVNNKSKVSHYGTNSTLVKTNSNTSVDLCYNCHNNTIVGADYGNTTQTTMANQIRCYECHNGEWKFERRLPFLPKSWNFYSAEPGNLHNQSMGTYWACSMCH